MRILSHLVFVVSMGDAGQSLADARIGDRDVHLRHYVDCHDEVGTCPRCLLELIEQQNDKGRRVVGVTHISICDETDMSTVTD